MGRAGRAAALVAQVIAPGVLREIVWQVVGGAVIVFVAGGAFAVLVAVPVYRHVLKRGPRWR